MKKIILSLVILASSMFTIQAQSNMVIHQGNGSKLSLPLQSIDSVRFNLVPPPATKRIFQNNGNILSLSVTDIDSITYTIPNRSTLPTLTTQAVTVLSSSSAFGGGNVSADGGSTVIQRGLCWNTSPNPTLANNFTVDGTGLGSFGSTMQPLSPAATYYVRAYATNANGTSYGNEISFVTATANNNGSLPTISTNQVVYMDSLSANCGGDITADGGLAVTARGVCWAIGTTPTINHNRTLDGSGAGSFNSRLGNLLPNTSYFVRAYATNDAGTAYGITFSFTTKGLPRLQIDSVYDKAFRTVRISGTILSDGGVKISERGFCWSYNPKPSVNDNIVLSGSGLGSFNQQLQPLQVDTLIYVRAFVGTSVGYIYSNPATISTNLNHCAVGPTKIVEVTNPITGKTWMDRNLGAARSATSSTDTASYGDLYQWGRGRDGHQCRNSDTSRIITSTPSGVQTSSFIITDSWQKSWFIGKFPDLWDGVNSLNNPCPRGFRLPTLAEFDAEVKTGLMNSILKLPLAGFRDYNGVIKDEGTSSYYYTSSTRDLSNSTAGVFIITATSSGAYSGSSRGNSVRCIKD